MKKGISTLCGLVFLLCFSPMLNAQNNAQADQIITIKEVTDQNGNTVTVEDAFMRGQKFQDIIDQLQLENGDAKDVKLRFLESDVHEATLEASDQEEMVFFYKAAKSDQPSKVELEQFMITIDDAMAQSIDEKKPLLGVYTNDQNSVLVTGLVYESGAQKAGIKKGDVLVAIDRVLVHSTADLGTEIQKHEVGETIPVEILRQGQSQEIMVTLGEKPNRHYFNRQRVYANHFDFEDDYYYNSFQERSPCDVFIGIFTSNGKKGLKIHNIIANTPAEQSTIQKGDIVVALDDVDVSSHSQLVAQRDLHMAGDYFTLSVLREGTVVDIDMQFDVCPEDKEFIKEVIEETSDFEITQNSLDLKNFSAFPNPTYGPVTLKFQGEAKPTTIRVTDTTGKTVYEEVLINFDGNYDNTLRMNKAVPGTLILSVIQGNEVYSQTVVYLPRA